MSRIIEKEQYKVCIIGSGLVAKPIIHYLDKNPEIDLTVASLFIDDIEEITEGKKSIHKKQLDVSHKKDLVRTLKNMDIVVSLLPAHMHLPVIEAAIETHTHFVNTSYLSNNIKKLNDKVISRNLIFINECGLDPGLDHMGTMSLVNKLNAERYKIVSYESYGSGIPAPEDNNNPWGYKFSWSPRGVITASKNPAIYLKDKIKYNKAPGTIFNSPWIVSVPGLPELEAYPNRDSLNYIDLYGLKNAETLIRGTLRNIGWSETLSIMYRIGLLNELSTDAPINSGRELFDILTDGKYATYKQDKLIERLNSIISENVLQKLEWLGLFDTNPMNQVHKNTMDALSDLMVQKMSYRDHEKDMVILHHIIKAISPSGIQKVYTSSLVGYGTPNGDSAMAKSVSLPAALAVEGIMKGDITISGINIPVIPEIYEPILKHMSKFGMEIKENELA